MSRDYFARVAPDWSTLRQEFFSDTVRDAAVMAARISPGAMALDVGAGAGFLSEALVAAGAAVTATDTSPEMLEQLRQRVPRVRTEVGDAEALPFSDDTFDAVLANMCIHHVERPAVAIHEMARVLRPGGRLVITDLDRHDHAFLRDEHHDRWLGFEREDIAAWLLAAGLDDVAVLDTQEDCCATSACGTDTARVSIFLASGTKPTVRPA